MSYPYCKCESCLRHNASRDMLAALNHVEAVMCIVEPRSHKAEYIETLREVRAAINKATNPNFEAEAPLRVAVMTADRG